MRKHDVRKWLHAILDLLPVILIPVFMIYSHRHDVAQDFEVTTQEPVYYESNEVTDSNSVLSGNVYSWTDNVTGDSSFSGYTNVFYLTYTDNLLNIGVPADKLNYRVVIIPNGYFRLYWDNADSTVDSVSIDNYTFSFVFLRYETNASSSLLNYVINFISISTDLIVKEYQSVVTNIPKDVMTSFMDRFNNTINQYFNMGNVFNLNGVYQWFNTNIFGGNAPTVIYSIWNIALYELCMDLLFLLYGLFMWFIDMIEKMMDRPFKSIK